ncbi:hypothetical protein JYT36_00310 [Bacteroidales bacterium AH-315-N07]|nr:hypothetical protein [Bacteroidales bacterium AH-315-N07]
MGGNLSYKFLRKVNASTYRYQITFTTYINCNSIYWKQGIFPVPDLDIGFYQGTADANTGLPQFSLAKTQTLNLPLVDSVRFNPDLPDTCTVGMDICISEVTYIDSIELPQTSDGYHLFYTNCCRDSYVVNIFDPNSAGMSFHAWIPPNFLSNNSSPVFTDLTLPYICRNDTTTILNTASDPDGHNLTFDFVTPFDANGGTDAPATLNVPIPDATYDVANGYSLIDLFGPSGYSFIKSSTGFTAFFPPDTGQFVVSVRIKEKSGADLVGVSRRDMQMLVIDCPANPKPNLSGASGSGQTNYIIEEGDTLCFPITFADQDGDSIKIEIFGDVFNVAIVDPPATVTTPVEGDSIATTQFCWNTACDQEQGNMYLFNAIATDNGCPNKTNSLVYEIKINGFTGPGSITGTDTVCPLDKGVSYSVTNISGAKYIWEITGGTQVAGDSSNTIQVDWVNSTSAQVKVTAVNKNGCPASPVTLSVTVDTLPDANAGIDVSFCSGANAPIGVANVSTYTYSWAPTTGLNNASVSQTLVTLINNGTIPDTNQYIVTVTDTVQGCSSTDTVLVVVRPFPIPDAGLDKSFCSGDTITIGADSTGGYLYAWNPTNGLSDSTDSKPELTLINSDSVPDTIQYIVLTELNGCGLYDSVDVIVKPIPVSNAGIDVIICQGIFDTIGAGSKANHLYSWFPTKGLNDSLISNPIVTLINDSLDPDTIQYVITTTLNNCSSKDTIAVFVLPHPKSDAGEDKTICPDENDTIGANSTVNYTYSWVSSYGLNDTGFSNPIVNINVPDTTILYVVTTTDTTTGCLSYDSINVVVKPLPLSNAGSDTIFCSRDTVRIGNDSTAGYTYLWLPTKGLTDSTVSDPFLTIVNPDTVKDTAEYIVYSTLNGCVTSDTVEVIIRPLPVADAGPDIGFCTGDNDTLGIKSIATYSYLWNPTDSLSDSTISNPVVSLVIPDSTNYMVKTTFEGCFSIDTALVIVHPLPQPREILGSISVCPGVDSVDYWVEGPENSIYTWSITGPGTIIGGQGNDTIKVKWDTSATATVFVFETDSNGCVGSAVQMDVRINVELEPPLPSGSDTICDRYINDVDYSVIYTNGSTYKWYVQGGSFVNGDSTNKVRINWNGVGSGILWYEEENQTIDTVCAGISETLYVSIFKSPVATKINGQFVTCEDTTSILYYIQGLTGSNFIWTIYNDTLNSGIGLDSINIVWDSAGIFLLSVIEITDSGCTETLMDSVVVNISPKTLVISGDTTICFLASDEYSYYVSGFDS